MQIQPETITWHQPAASSKSSARAEIFRLTSCGGDRINGSMPVWGRPQTAEEDIAAKLSAAAKPEDPAFAASLAETETPKKDSFGFFDVLDMINPLQHIPVVSSIYRSMTGDEIKPVSRVVGGAAFGGPLGAASGVVNALFQMETGKDVADNMVASIEGKNDGPGGNDTTIAVANLAHGHNSYAQRSYNT